MIRNEELFQNYIRYVQIVINVNKKAIVNDEDKLNNYFKKIYLRVIP